MTPAPEGGLPGFYLGHEQLDGIHVLRVGGELDLHAAPQVRSALDELIEKGARSIVLDLSETSFIDSTALGAIVGAHKQLQPDGGLQVVCTNEHVLRIFGYAGLDAILSIHDDRDAALAALR
jgi:anti-sigma B factor antagonist